MATPDYLSSFEADGHTVWIRPIRPDDREREAAFVRGLSRESRYFRFHSALRELTPDMLERFVHNDYPDALALVAYLPGPAGDEQIGVARYVREGTGDTAEMAIVVADAWQGKGVGTHLLLALRDLAQAAGIRRLVANVLRENGRMQALARQLGYDVDGPSDDLRARRLGKPLEG
ncbi:MAG: GNAT family N-acetyltransferase [Pseudomonadales bacterium]|nr:GNAT family N-acetyltransferase [Pseudomonadales bacterium]